MYKYYFNIIDNEFGGQYDYEGYLKLTNSSVRMKKPATLSPLLLPISSLSLWTRCPTSTRTEKSVLVSIRQDFRHSAQDEFFV